MLVGAIGISSFFSFSKLDIFSDLTYLKKPLSDIISYFPSTQLITSDFFSVILELDIFHPRYISLNIYSIPSKGYQRFPSMYVLYNLRKSVYLNHSSQICVAYSVKPRCIFEPLSYICTIRVIIVLKSE